jgi:hypothetical protein
VANWVLDAILFFLILRSFGLRVTISLRELWMFRWDRLFARLLQPAGRILRSILWYECLKGIRGWCSWVLNSGIEKKDLGSHLHCIGMAAARC